MLIDEAMPPGDNPIAVNIYIISLSDMPVLLQYCNVDTFLL